MIAHPGALVTTPAHTARNGTKPPGAADSTAAGGHTAHVEHMGVLDATFVHLDRPSTPLHVGSLFVFDGPAPGYDELRSALESRLHLVPRYRQKVRTVPLHLATPVWVDDPHFTTEYHVRHTALPAPGDDDQLRRLVGRVMSVPLDFGRSPWEMWLVEGLAGGRWALVNKTHHCMIDGMSGADITSLLLSRRPDEPVVPGPDWTPRPEPTDREILADGVAHAVLHPARRAAHLSSVVADAPRLVAMRSAATLKGLGSALRSVAPEPFGLNGSIGPNRRWTWASASLEDVKVARRQLGVTLNDLVLSAITLGLREWLLGRGLDVSGRVVTSLVPVSTRPAAASAQHDNQVSGMLADLPVGIADPLQVVAAVSEQMRTLKSSGESVGFTMMVKAADFVPSSLFALGARVAVQAPQRSVATVTTNVPGPQWPLYLLHSRLLRLYPYIPLANDVRLTIGIFSYDGSLYLGLTGDYDALPDLDGLGEAVERGFATLTAAVARDARGHARSSRPLPEQPLG